MAPAAALIAAAAAGEPLLAHWTQTFMGGGAQFLAQFFPLFLLGALFGKLMEDSGSVEAIARFMTQKLGTGRAVLAVVLAGAIVTYGGVSLFVAIFVIVPMAQRPVQDRRHTATPDARRHRPRHHDLYDVGVAWHAGPAKCHPDAVLRHDALRCPGSRHHRGCHHACASVCGGSDRAENAPDARVRVTGARARAETAVDDQSLCASAQRSPANSIPPRSRTAHVTAAPPGALIALAAAGRGHSGQPRHERVRAAATRHELSRGGALGQRRRFPRLVACGPWWWRCWRRSSL